MILTCLIIIILLLAVGLENTIIIAFWAIGAAVVLSIMLAALAAIA